MVEENIDYHQTESYLPKLRGHSPFMCAAIIFLLYMLVDGIYTHNSNSELFDLLFSYFLGEMLYTLSLYAEEVRHLHTHHHNSHWAALKMTLPQARSLGVIPILFFLYDSTMCFSTSMLLALAIPLLRLIMGQREVEIAKYLEKQPVDIGSGMAWSFFCGYLKLTLSENDKQPSLAERIENYEMDEEVQVAVKKLFIVLPENCYCPKQFDRIDRRIQPERTLKSIEISRAGVKMRNYGQHTVYLLQGDDGERLRVLVEAATPLMSLYEMAQEDFSKTGIDESMKRQQMKIFYRTLRMILYERYQEIGDQIELVYHTDADSMSLSERLKRRIHELRNGATGPARKSEEKSA